MDDTERLKFELSISEMKIPERSLKENIIIQLYGIITKPNLNTWGDEQRLTDKAFNSYRCDCKFRHQVNLLMSIIDPELSELKKENYHLKKELKELKEGKGE